MSDPSSPPDPRVEEVLQKVRSGVRQRQAEAATLGSAAEAARSRLLELKQRELVQEPVPLSHRPSLGRWIVLSRKSFFKIFLKWFARPVLEQQNAYNQTASRLIEELVESHERLEREVRQLSARLERLEGGGGE
jgi:hypothetical protein